MKAGAEAVVAVAAVVAAAVVVVAAEAIALGSGPELVPGLGNFARAPPSTAFA